MKSVMCCQHLLKLPLYLIALPFYILSAVGRAGMYVASGGGRLWQAGFSRHTPGSWHRRHKSRSAVRVPVSHVAAAAVVPRRPKSRFVPGMAVGLLGCMLLLFAMRGGFVDTQSRTDYAVPTRMLRLERSPVPLTAVPLIVEREIQALLAKVTGPGHEPIPVVIPAPPESGEDLPPAEAELGAKVEKHDDAIASDDAVVSSDAEESEERPVTVFTGIEPVGKTVTELPEWVSNVSTSETGFPGIIKTSQHATVDDAEKEALLLLRLALSKRFAVLQPHAKNWLPPEEVVLNAGVVTRRAVERDEINVGEFTEPVFRAYWDVTQPEDLESRLFAAWRPEVLESRLWLLGGGIGLLTLLFGSMAGYFRLDDATHGKHRNKLRVGTGAVWALIVAGSAVLLVA